MGIEARARVAPRGARQGSAAPLPALAAGGAAADFGMDAVDFGPLRVDRRRREELAEIVERAVASGGDPLAVAFCNVHTAEIALRDARLADALGRFLVVNDGIGLEVGARILSGRGFPENLNGTDFIPYLFGRLSRPTRVYLLGGLPGVAEEAARSFSTRFPHVVVVGCQHGGFGKAEEAAVAAAVRAAAPDILLVAMGNPKQEIFIADHFDALGAQVMFGVGALFDFVSGRIPRAPERLRRLRLEWAFRLWLEPGRLAHRYTAGTAAFFAATIRLRLAAAHRRSS
jgi:alpha-1,3-mannosyltransferase